MSSISKLSPHSLSNLITTREYAEADKIFESAQRSSDHHSTTGLFLMAARQICAACVTLSETSEFHQWAADETERQEKDLRQLLQTITGVLENGDDPIIVETTAARLSKNDSQTVTLWQRIQNLLLGNEAVVPTNGDHTVTTDVCYPVKTIPLENPQPTLTPPLPLRSKNASNGRSASLNGKSDREHQLETASIPPLEIHHSAEHQLVIYGLGIFQVYYHGKMISDWPNRKSKSLFKYLLWHRERPVAKESLMEIFWPATNVDAARNNLNVTIYNLRQILRDVQRRNILDENHEHNQSTVNSDESDTETPSFILFHDDKYLINPELHLWIDFEVFNSHCIRAQEHMRLGRKADALQEYEAAEALYEGELYEEDRYDDWVIPYRESLNRHYLDMLSTLCHEAFARGDYARCITYCHKQLTFDECHEEAHRFLMHCYIARKQLYLAMRQYYRCVEILKSQLDVSPSLETVALYEQIKTAL